MDVINRPFKEVGTYKIHYYKQRPRYVTGQAWEDPQTPLNPLPEFRGGLNLYEGNFSPILVPPEIAQLFEKKAILSPLSKPGIKYAVELMAYSDIDTYIGIGIHPKTYVEISDSTSQRFMDYEAGVVIGNKRFVREEEKEVVDIRLHPFPEIFSRSFNSLFFNSFKNSSGFQNPPA